MPWKCPPATEIFEQESPREGSTIDPDRQEKVTVAQTHVSAHRSVERGVETRKIGGTTQLGVNRSQTTHLAMNSRDQLFKNFEKIH